MDASPSQNHTHRENRKTTALKCQITHYPLDPFKTVRNLENTKTHTLVSCLYQVFVQTSIPTFFATFSKVNVTSVEYASPAPNRILLKSSHRNMKKQNHICDYCDICHARPTKNDERSQLLQSLQYKFPVQKAKYGLYRYRCVSICISFSCALT